MSMIRQGLVVAIDGPAGSGKSTAARMLAEAEGLTYLNTGAMYRAVTYLTDEGGIDPQCQSARVVEIARKMVFTYALNPGGTQRFLVAPAAGQQPRDLTEVLFSTALTLKLKPIVNNEEVRAALVEKMRSAVQELLRAGARGVILEGRDIGTVVFPDAFLKFFIQADLDERTRRRAEELRTRNEVFEESGLKRQIEYRDEVDRNRQVGPLRKADDAILIDTSGLDRQATLLRLREELHKRLAATRQP